MARFHFDIHENDRFIEDEEGRDLDDDEEVRRLALATGASIARDAFVEGSANRIVIDVRKDDAPFMRVAISLSLE
ncbi:MAG: hypothetical protein JOZ74_12680 [Bradyrhizobium sp.]|nr:hypothetical protein [Bradyrhizobium sp.]